LDIWNKKSGASLGTYTEGLTTSIPLPLNSLTVQELLNTKFSIISGRLPEGLLLKTVTIEGTPFQVFRSTDYVFVIRAKNIITNEISDRTFSITIDGPDIPVIVTPENLLAIGPNNTFFILDSSPVEFQIEAFDLDTAPGQKLNFFIDDSEGYLPPGLTMDRNGLIKGFIDPLLSIPIELRSGNFDIEGYDSFGFDFNIKSDNGYDSFNFDTITFDYSAPFRGARKLNRNYEFYVTITDGDTYVKRKFRIYVVGEDYLRADNTIMLVGTNTYLASSSSLRIPFWRTPPDLGIIRSNNYHIIKLDIYDVIDYFSVQYYFEPFIKESEKTLTTFTKTSTDNIENSMFVTIKNPTQLPLIDEYISFIGLIDTQLKKIYKIKNVFSIGPKEYRLTIDSPLAFTIPNNRQIKSGSLSVLPPGLKLDITSGEIFGILPYQNDIYLDYKFSVTATRFGNDNESSSATRTFSLRVIGDRKSNLYWETGSNLGSIAANYVSMKKIVARSTIPVPNIEYKLLSGALPSGLTLESSGEITGTIKQYTGEGLTTFFDRKEGELITNQIFDGGATLFDKTFRFTVRAQDQLEYSSVDREFTLNIETPNDRLFSNIYVKTYMSEDKRRLFERLMNDGSIFFQTHLYRANDPNFGVRKDLKMLMYAGIETKNIEEYISIVGLNHKRKRFRFGQVKTAKAYDPDTNLLEYEVIYVEMIDPLDFKDRHLPLVTSTPAKSIKKLNTGVSNYIWKADGQDIYITKKEPFLLRPFENISIDRTNITVSDPNQTKRYPSTVYNWRNRIKTHKGWDGNTLITEQTFLPLWMRSFQDDRQQLGFTLAIPLCYCNPNMSYDIMLNIENYQRTTNFDFKDLDYYVDRYIIDNVIGYGNDKYVVFKDQEASV